MQTLNEKLFHAVCKGKTGGVEKLLEQGANINTRDKRDGMTPLLKACQRRNFTMQRILLSKGANPKLKDEKGLSCLHYIAEAGDTESLKLLMAYHASLDSKDVRGSTPLHYASDRNKPGAVDTLVFCGANAFEKNKNGVSPLKSTNDPGVQKILKESELILTGIKNGDIHIESLELEPNKSYRLDNIDLTIHTPSTFQLKSLSLICRRVRPEYCHPSLKPYQKELLISDTFEFLTSETQCKAKVSMEVPIYDYPDPFEDIYMKTDITPTVQPSLKQSNENVKRSRDEKSPGRLKWVCTTEIDITMVRSFNLVAFPRTEKFLVGKTKAEIYSSVDKFIKISIQDSTFNHPKGKISLEVIPTPVYPPEHITSVLSAGHFYDLTHDRLEQPQKPINMRVPLPQDYEGEGDVYLLGADIGSDYYLDEGYDSSEDFKHWEVISQNPKVTKGCVNIPVNHFSIYVATEAKKDDTRKQILSDTSDLCRRASLKTQFTVFLVLVKPVGADVFKVMVECTTKRKRDDRINFWINKNYLDQKPSFTGEFESIPGTKYLLQLSGNVSTVSGFPKTRLEFHPKRENYQQFQVRMSDPKEFNAASVDIYELKDLPDGTEEEKELASVPFRLTGTPFIQDLEPDEDESFAGFTKDSLLRQLCKQMDNEWIKVAVLLGMSFRTVEAYRTNTKMSVPDKKFKVMQIWRDTSKHRVDYGVDDLVSALHRIDREDLVQLVQKELLFWLKTHSDNPDRFYKWTESKLTGPTFHSTDQGQPVPSSDQFFVLLIDKFGNDENIVQVGLHMGLSGPETDKIFNDALVSSREHQLLRMFVSAREKIGDMFKTFEQLISSLEAVYLTDAVSWIKETSEEWLSNTEKEKNPVPWRQEILHYLHQSSREEDDNDSYDENKQSEADENEDKENREQVTDDHKDDLNETDQPIERDNETNKSQSDIDITSKEKLVDDRGSNTSLDSIQSTKEVNQQAKQQTRPVRKKTGSSVSVKSTSSSDETVQQNRKSKVKGSDRKGSNISIHSSSTNGESVLQSRKQDSTINLQDEYKVDETSIESSQDMKNTTKHEKGQHIVDDSEQRLDRYQYENDARGALQDEELPVTTSEYVGEHIASPDEDKQEATQGQREFASQLSHMIVDQALESVIVKDTHVTEDQGSRDANSFKDLRQLLETNIVHTTTSVDPSVASSHEHVTDSEDVKQVQTPKDQTETHSTSSNDSKSDKHTADNEGRENAASPSNSGDNDSGRKESFLGVLNQQLPNAESSEDSLSDY